jgi:hypothetical protein
MYIVTIKLQEDKHIELIVDGMKPLLNIANYFEKNKTEFKVMAGNGIMKPELFGWDPIEQWKYWKVYLYKK